MKHRADHATLGRSLRPRGPIHLDLSTRQAPEATVVTVTGELDVLTARNAGMWSVGLTYGFSPQSLEIVVPDVSVDRPEEIPLIFEPQLAIGG